MLKLRKSLFETNSSSADRYDDYDDYDTTPSHSTCKQRVYVEFETADDITEADIDHINDIFDENIEDLTDILGYWFEDGAEDSEIDEFDGDTLILTYTMTCRISFHGGYKGDRYCPPEDPEMEIDDSDGVPGKNGDYPQKNNDIKKFMDFFANHGITKITGIKNIYGTDPDEDEVYDNISW